MAESLPSTMRAMRLSSTTGGLEKNLSLDSSTPIPKNANSLPSGASLIKVAYAAPNPVDFKVPEIPLISSLPLTWPSIPCGDYAGTIIATKSANLKPGDRVFGRSDGFTFGAFGEYIVVSGKDEVNSLPDSVSTRDAATTGVAAVTAYQCIAPFVNPGAKVFINGGSGGCGTFGIQMAKVLGCTVTVTCSGANVQLCKDLGADEVIDYRTTNVVEHLKRQGTQYDHIVDNVGSSELYYNAHHYLKANGMYAQVAGEMTLSAVLQLLGIFLIPAWLGGGQRKFTFIARKSDAKHYATIAGWMSEGKLKAVIEKEYPLEEAGDAIARLKSGRVRGKLVVKVAEG